MTEKRFRKVSEAEESKGRSSLEREKENLPRAKWQQHQGGKLFEEERKGIEQWEGKIYNLTFQQTDNHEKRMTEW